MVNCITYHYLRELKKFNNTKLTENTSGLDALLIPQKKRKTTVFIEAKGDLFSNLFERHICKLI